MIRTSRSNMEEDVQQTIVQGRLRWYRRFLDHGHEVAVEDGVEFPPEDLRRRIMERDGVWELVVPTASAATVAHQLGQLPEVDARQILANMRRQPGVPYIGTETEVEWLQLALAKADIDSKKRKYQETR